jgi:hypothetical protein
VLELLKLLRIADGIAYAYVLRECSRAITVRSVGASANTYECTYDGYDAQGLLTHTDDADIYRLTILQPRPGHHYIVLQPVHPHTSIQRNNAKCPTMRLYKRCFIITLGVTVAQAGCDIPRRVRQVLIRCLS